MLDIKFRVEAQYPVSMCLNGFRY